MKNQDTGKLLQNLAKRLEIILKKSTRQGQKGCAWCLCWFFLVLLINYHCILNDFVKFSNDKY